MFIRFDNKNINIDSIMYTHIVIKGEHLGRHKVFIQLVLNRKYTIQQSFDIIPSNFNINTKSEFAKYQSCYRSYHNPPLGEIGIDEYQLKTAHQTLQHYLMSTTDTPIKQAWDNLNQQLTFVKQGNIGL